jgi:hypothetical protein
MWPRLVVVLSILLPVAGASAQVVYEPVRIQYGDAQPYYYAGNDARIHAAAAGPGAPGAAWGRVGGFAFVNDRRQVTQPFARTYTDAFGIRDARPFGLTIDAVWNEANARVPRVFRKSATVRPAAIAEPTRAGTIEIKPWRPRSTTRPAMIGATARLSNAGVNR